jgi:hypothetical protein
MVFRNAANMPSMGWARRLLPYLSPPPRPPAHAKLEKLASQVWSTSLRDRLRAARWPESDTQRLLQDLDRLEGRIVHLSPALRVARRLLMAYQYGNSDNAGNGGADPARGGRASTSTSTSISMSMSTSRHVGGVPLAILTSLNGGDAHQVLAWTHRWALWVSTTLLRRDPFEVEAVQLAALGRAWVDQGGYPSAHLRIGAGAVHASGGDRGRCLQLVLPHCPYRTLFTERGVPELLQATCCALEGTRWEGMPRGAKGPCVLTLREATMRRASTGVRTKENDEEGRMAREDEEEEGDKGEYASSMVLVVDYEQPPPEEEAASSRTKKSST